jgi:hypothetical protein
MEPLFRHVLVVQGTGGSSSRMHRARRSRCVIRGTEGNREASPGSTDPPSTAAVALETAPSTPTAPATPAPTPPPTPEPTPDPTPPPPPPPPPPPCQATVPANPWGYDFCFPGTSIANPPDDFCSYFRCIDNFWNGRGSVIQCQDGRFSKSGGVQGSCSRHGGNGRYLYSH